ITGYIQPLERLTATQFQRGGVSLFAIVIHLAGLVECGGRPVYDGFFQRAAIAFLSIDDFAIAQQVALGIEILLLPLLEAGTFPFLIETVNIPYFQAVAAYGFETLPFFRPFHRIEMNAGFDNGDDLLGAGSFRFMLNRKLT